MYILNNLNDFACRSNFLSVIGYWTAFFIVIIAEEHFIFRRKGGLLGGYDLEVYDDITKLVTIRLSLLSIHTSLSAYSFFKDYLLALLVSLLPAAESQVPWLAWPKSGMWVL